MSMPKFTAEASLYKTPKNYRRMYSQNDCSELKLARQFGEVKYESAKDWNYIFARWREQMEDSFWDFIPQRGGQSSAGGQRSDEDEDENQCESCFVGCFSYMGGECQREIERKCSDDQGRRRPDFRINPDCEIVETSDGKCIYHCTYECGDNIIACVLSSDGAYPY